MAQTTLHPSCIPESVQYITVARCSERLYEFRARYSSFLFGGATSMLARYAVELFVTCSLGFYRYAGWLGQSFCRFCVQSVGTKPCVRARDRGPSSN